MSSRTEHPAAKPLDYETLKAAFDALKNEPPRICEHHVVHPKVYRRGGWTNCANCGKAVFCGGD